MDNSTSFLHGVYAPFRDDHATFTFQHHGSFKRRGFVGDGQLPLFGEGNYALEGGTLVLHFKEMEGGEDAVEAPHTERFELTVLEAEVEEILRFSLQGPGLEDDGFLRKSPCGDQHPYCWERVEELPFEKQ